MRKQGTFPESSNVEGKIAWTFDARNMVQSYADLLTFTPANYIPNGFPVAVFDADPSKRGIYICINKDDLSNPLSWEKGSLNANDYYTKDQIDQILVVHRSYQYNNGVTDEGILSMSDRNDIPSKPIVSVFENGRQNNGALYNKNLNQIEGLNSPGVYPIEINIVGKIEIGVEVED